MNHLTLAQLTYVLQFSHVEKILAHLPHVTDTHIAGMFGLRLGTYRKIRRRFTEQARKAAEELLRNSRFAELVARLPFKRGQVVVGLGDSITDDYQSWIEILRYLLERARPADRIQVVNAGISGNTTTEMISRFLDVVLRRPDWIICMAGTNDARRHGQRPAKVLVSPEETAKNLAMLRNFAATQTTAEWIWMTPPTVIEKKIAAHWFLGPMQMMWRNKDIAAVARAVRGQAGEVVDLHKLFGNSPDPDLLMPDGLHPSIRGQKLIVSVLVKHLARAKQS